MEQRIELLSWLDQRIELLS